MNVVRLCRQAGSLAMLLFLVAAPPARGEVIRVSTPAEVGDGHYSDWGALGPLDTYIPGPFAITASNGERITLSSVSRVNTDPPVVGGLLHHLVGHTFGPPALNATAAATPGFAQIDVVFAFDRPVQAFGADISAFAQHGTNAGDTRVTMEALDATGTSLGAFTLASDLFFAGFTGYAGVLSDSTNISQVRYRAHAGFVGSFYTTITSIDVISVDIAGGSTAVPEPTSLALACIGVVGFVAARRLRSRWRPRPLNP